MEFREILERLRHPLGRNNVGLWGDFGMQVFDVSGETPRRMLRIRKKNQITNDGRTALLNLMGIGDSAAPLWTDVQRDNRIWSLSVGTNPTPPVVVDTLSVMSVVWNDSFTFPAECQIVATPPNTYYLAISKTLPAVSAADGNTLSEAGILTYDNSLYARQIHSPILKTSTMTIQYDWQIGITIV